MKKDKKIFKVLIECQIQYSVADNDTDDEFARDSDFVAISEEIIKENLDANASNIKILSVQEQE